MATKGQKFRKYSLEFKQKVLKEYRQGNSKGSLSKKYGIPVGTIETWSCKYRKEGTLEPTKRKGRPPGKTNYKEKWKTRKTKKY